MNRRGSSGVLLSPEVELTGSITKPLGEALESDGFYLLKKDSQRRTTLSKVLAHDEATICDIWLQKIKNNHDVVISKEHLKKMNNALREYIINQNKEALEGALTGLKESVDYDSTAIDHLHLALYMLQVSDEEGTLKEQYFNGRSVFRTRSTPSSDPTA